MTARDRLWDWNKLALLYDAIFNDAKMSTVTPGATAVGTSNSVILPANAKRKYALLVNNGEVDIFLAKGRVATWNLGPVLKPYGGAYEMNHTNLYLGTISAITTVGSLGVFWEEGV